MVETLDAEAALSFQSQKTVIGNGRNRLAGL